MDGHLYHGSRSSDLLVSVVVRARNAAATVDDQLVALVGQEVDGPWEVVVVDDGTDGTTDRVRRWRTVAPWVRVVPAGGRPAAASARNVGAAAAGAARILFCDADGIVGRDWVTQLLEGLRSHDVVTGPVDRGLLNDPEVHSWLPEEPAVELGAPPHASEANLGVHRSVLEALRGFDPSVPRDFGWRAVRAGYTIGFVPGAVVHERLRDDLLGAARQRFAAAQAEPLLYRRYGGEGAVRREPLADVKDAYHDLLREVPRVIRSRSRARRHRFVYRLGGRAGRVVGSVRHRTLFL